MPAFWVSAKAKYRYEGYRNEDLIIYDDCWPKLEELLDVSNTYMHRKPIYGETRYKKCYWKPKHTRTMVVLTNRMPPYYETPSFMARFIVKCVDPVPQQEEDMGSVHADF